MFRNVYLFRVLNVPVIVAAVVVYKNTQPSNVTWISKSDLLFRVSSVLSNITASKEQPEFENSSANLRESVYTREQQRYVEAEDYKSSSFIALPALPEFILFYSTARYRKII